MFCGRRPVRRSPPPLPPLLLPLRPWVSLLVSSRFRWSDMLVGRRLSIMQGGHSRYPLSNVMCRFMHEVCPSTAEE